MNSGDADRRTPYTPPLAERHVPAQSGLEHLSFLDGYLFRVMVQTMRSEGVDPSGFYNYYRVRVEETGSALSPYDRMLCGYVKTHFDPLHRQIVHAATGLGTLPAALAFSGHTVAAVEYDARRFRSASRMRNALSEIWPEVVERYTLIEGEFPGAVIETPWMTRKTVLIFTNSVATMSDDQFAKWMASLQTCGDIIFEARLFGRMRETLEERQTLLGELETLGWTSTPIEQSPPGNFFYHLRSKAAG